jgi:hypothetical protein
MGGCVLLTVEDVNDGTDMQKQASIPSNCCWAAKYTSFEVGVNFPGTFKLVNCFVRLTCC